MSDCLLVSCSVSVRAFSENESPQSGDHLKLEQQKEVP